MNQVVLGSKPFVQTMTQAQDFYIYTMGLLVHRYHKDVPVRFAFKNRTQSVRLGQEIDMGWVNKQLDHVRGLGHTPQEVAFIMGELHRIRGTTPGNDPLLDDGSYAEFLHNLRLPDYKLDIVDGGNLRLEFAGPWCKTMFWEIPALCAVNQAYADSCAYRFIVQPDTESRGREILERKIKILERNPQIKFADFGTRRRHDLAWQMYVVETLAQRLPAQFLGTSCVSAAMAIGTHPIGTNAHQLPMIYSALFHGPDSQAFKTSQLKVLEDWWNLYGSSMSIVLPDTYTTDYMLSIMSRDMALNFRGMRQDSGDPMAMGEKIVHFYESLDIDPCSKTIIFSDGLDVEQMLRIEERFRGRINVLFGWGTNLTNDVGIKPISIVIKPVEACGLQVIKISDNPEKATGSAYELKRIRSIINCQTGPAIACVY